MSLRATVYCNSGDAGMSLLISLVYSGEKVEQKYLSDSKHNITHDVILPQEAK